MLPRLQWALAKSGLSLIALRVDNSASFNLPRSLSMFPRLQWALAKSGLSLIALRVDNSASCKLSRS